MAEIKTPPQKLTALDPRWKLTTDGEVYGIAYRCPCGLPVWDGLDSPPYDQCCQNGGTQVVPTKTNFHPAGKPTCVSSIERGWDLTGDSWETISLSPSIHQVGHWHGQLVDGVLEGGG